MKFIVKFFPEITIKSRSVRKRFTTQLQRNIFKVLSRIDGDISVTSHWDFIHVAPSDITSETLERIKIELQRIPGITAVLCSGEYQFESIDDILKICIENYHGQLDGHSFCVRAKRRGKHTFSSLDIEKDVGAGLLKAFPESRVDLKQPDIKVQLEIDKHRVFIEKDRVKGMGGFPLGTQERALTLISGGYDSSVSSYLMMARGVKVSFCFFNLGGTTHEIGVKQVSHYLWSKYGSSHRAHFISVPFEKVIEQIVTRIPHAYRGVVLKRCMLRAASELANRMKFDALVTGESIAQVSSQTLPNLAVIDRVTDNLVLRPLTTMNKQDIINVAKDIGTEEFARNMPEFCGVISKKPTIKAKLDVVEEAEAELDANLITQVVAETEIVDVDSLMHVQQNLSDIETVNMPHMNDIVIDIRHPDEVEKRALDLTNNQVLNIPFYELGREFSNLDQGRSYLLFCERGVMSHLHAQQLIAEGFKNIRLYSEKIQDFV